MLIGSQLLILGPRGIELSSDYLLSHKYQYKFQSMHRMVYGTEVLKHLNLRDPQTDCAY